jgi:hypothetical protein
MPKMRQFSLFRYLKKKYRGNDISYKSEASNIGS